MQLQSFGVRLFAVFMLSLSSSMALAATAAGGDPCADAHTDAFEPNNTFATSSPIDRGLHVDLFLSDSDPDFYVFTLPVGAHVDVEVPQTTGGLTFQVWRDSSRQPNQIECVSQTNHTSFPIDITFRPMTDVNGPSLCATHDLLVTVSDTGCTPGVEDSLEPNNACADAPLLNPGVYTQLTRRAGDADFYSVQVQPGDVLWVAELDDSGGELVYRLYDSNCSSFLVPFAPGGLLYEHTGSLPVTLVLEAWLAPSGAGVTCSVYGFELFVGPAPCEAIEDDILENNDTCAGAKPLASGTYPSLIVHSDDEDHFVFVVEDGATFEAQLAFEHARGDVDCRLWDADEVLCSGVGTGVVLARSNTTSDDEALEWVNQSGSTQSVILEVRLKLSTISPCNTYDLFVAGSSGSGSVGVVFCDPAEPNSVGFATQLEGNLTSSADSSLHLNANFGPPGEYGYFLVGASFQDPGVVIGQGRFCLTVDAAGPCCRLNVGGTDQNSIGRFDHNGLLRNIANTSASGFGFDVPAALPLPGNPQVMPGDTWHFQLWHRDGGGQSNFSNGLTVDF